MIYPIVIRNAYIYEEIADERNRQEQLRREGKFSHTAASPDDARFSDGWRLAALMEEVGEAAEAALERAGFIGKPKGTDLRKELVQVAAICVAWIEALDATHGDAELPVGERGAR
jgi:NTP pyrophosphatase (non-canonical NTP hydrolase)